MMGWGVATEAKAVIHGKDIYFLTLPGFLRMLSRISMEGTW